MIQAAEAFLNELQPDEQRRAVFPMDHDERFNWNYVPCERNGLALRELTKSQQEAAFALLRSSLSDAGYEKSVEIMQLERILKQIEGRDPEDNFRDPEGYFFTLYGTVSNEEPWGWRVDGHHLSLNFSSLMQQCVTTPAFWGSNPGEVLEGPHRGKRILKAEEDLGRGLFQALEPAQQARAMIAEDAPNDIVTKNSKEARIGNPVGLSASEMAPGQQSQLMELVGLYVRNFREDLKEKHLERIEKAGTQNLHFAWAGGVQRRQKHYYRVHGPTLLIEYDNTQNDANHIHTVVRDLELDFGLDLLRKHYQDSDHHR